MSGDAAGVGKGGELLGDPPVFPFSAVVGQEEAKTALLLNAVDPGIGGVLLRGQKGSAKSTLARGLAALLPGAAPFVELPVGATEDRLIGTLDVTRALTTGERHFEPGLLAAAHGGVLYVDEINLLPDHLVDALLDVAASGVNRIEREGVSHTHPSRFVLIGSMNPEEGDLRPQLLDRFGLAATVIAPTAPEERALAVRRRLAWDAAPRREAEAWQAAQAELAARLEVARPAALPEMVVDAVAALCASVDAEGLRADLTICRSAAALAGWEGRPTASVREVRQVAHLALGHRARRNPLDHTGLERPALDEALDALVPPEGARPGDDGARPGDDGAGPEDGGTPPPGDIDELDGAADPAGSTSEQVIAPSGSEPRAVHLDDQCRRPPAPGMAAPGRREPAPSRRGRVVGDRAADAGPGSVALGATARAAMRRREGMGAGALGAPLVEAGDVRIALREERRASLVVVVVDASGSMGAEQRMGAAKAAVLGLLVDAYQRRDLVALVAFRGEGAEVLLRPTGSVEVARARLTDLATGGRTPLAAGLEAACEVIASSSRATSHRPLLVVVTDGRATSAARGLDPVAAAEAAAAEVRRREIPAVVVDVETGATRLGLARQLAATMGARHVSLAEVTPAGLEQVVRSRVG